MPTRWSEVLQLMPAQFRFTISLSLRGQQEHIVTWRVGEDEGIKVQLSDAEWDEAVERTQGYSGSDLSHVITDACYQPLEEGMRMLATPEQQAGITDEHVRPVVWHDLEVRGHLNVTN